MNLHRGGPGLFFRVFGFPLQADERVKKMSHGRIKDDLESVIKCGRAAMQWQQASITLGSTAELQRSHEVLVAEGHEVCRGALLEFCGKVASEYASEGRWTDWAGVLGLSVQEWSVSKPGFGALLPSRVATEALEEFWALWQAAFLCDPLLEAIKGAGESAAMIAGLRNAVEGFLALMKMNEKDVPQYVLDGSGNATQFARGLLALIVPTPLHMGSSQADVNFVFPLSVSSRNGMPVAKVFPTSGKTALRYMDCDLWKTRITNYRLVAGGEASRGPELQKFSVQVAVFSAEFPADTSGMRTPDPQVFVQVDVFLNMYLDNIDAWLGCFRAGGTDEMEKLVVTMISDNIGFVCTSADQNTRMELYQRALSKMSVEEASPHLQRVTEVLSEICEKDKVAGLSMAASCTFDSCDKVVALRKACQRVQNKVKEITGFLKPEIIELLISARWMVLRFCVAGFKQDPAAFDWEACTQVIDTIEAMVLVSPEDKDDSAKICTGITKIATFVDLVEGRTPFTVQAALLHDEIATFFESDAPKFAAELLWNSLRNFTTESKAVWEEALVGKVTAFVVLQTKELKIAIDDVKLIAAGGARGKTWWRDCSEGADILAHFNDTLDKIKATILESKTNRLKDALDNCTAAQDMLKTWVPADAEIGGMIEDGAAVFTRCKMTKCEVLCMRSLRDSRRKREHLQKYIAAFSSDTSTDWRTMMWPRMVTKVCDIIGVGNEAVATAVD